MARRRSVIGSRAHRGATVGARRRSRQATSLPRERERCSHEARPQRSATGASGPPPPSSSSSCRRPSGWASTPSGRPRPTGPTRRPCSRWLAGQTSTIRLGSAIFQMPGRSPAMTAMTAATLDHLSGGRFMLGLGLVRAAGGRGLARRSASPASSSGRASTSRSCGSRCRASGASTRARRSTLPLPDGPGKALKLTIGTVQERIPIYLAAIGPKNTELAGRDRRRLAADPRLARSTSTCSAPSLDEGGRARRDRSARRASTSRRPCTVRIDDDLDARARRRCAATSRSTSAAWARATRTSTTGSCASLRVRGRRARGAGPLPRRAQGGRDGGAARRADRRRHARAGRPTRVRDRLRAFRDAGVGTLIASPVAWTLEDRLAQLRALAELAALMRVLLGAFGDPGHAFPMLALGSRLVERGHDVCLQTWRQAGEADVEAAGMEFAAAPEYQVFPTPGEPLKPYAAAVRAARETVPLVEAFAPDVAVSDILTLAPALGGGAVRRPGGDARAARRARQPAPGFPPYSMGARLPRTRAGRAFWRALRPAGPRRARARPRGLQRRAARGSACRRCEWLHTGLSRSLTLVATLPAARVPARLAAVDARGRAADVGAAGRGGRCRRRATARSCSSRRRPRTTPSSRCCAPRCDGLASEPVRVIATWNGREPPWLGADRCPPTPCSCPGSPTRGRCRAATSWSATAATARSCAR